MATVTLAISDAPQSAWMEGTMLRQRRRRVQPPTMLLGNSRWHHAYTLQRQHDMMYSMAVSEA